MSEHKRVYIPTDTYKALKAFCDDNDLKMYAFLKTAVEEAIAKRSMARRWDGEQWVYYEVETVTPKTG